MTGLGIKIKKILLLIGVCIILLFTACSYREDTTTESDTLTINFPTTTEAEMETTTEQTIRKYKEALSEDELSKTEELAKEYYKQHIIYELYSMEVAENDFEYYYDELIINYQAGNIIIFLTETSHSGYGSYRNIVLVRENKNSSWEVFTEGK